jgi:hypothetical protein
MNDLKVLTPNDLLLLRNGQSFPPGQLCEAKMATSSILGQQFVSYIMARTSYFSM